MRPEIIKFAKKMERFMSNLSDASKEWYLTEFAEMFTVMINFLDKLGLMYEFMLELEEPEKLFMADLLAFIEKIEQIKNEVLK